MKKILIFLLLPIYVNAQVPSSGGYLLTNSNGSVSIGTQVNTAPLTVTNFTTAFPTPQTGTLVHLVSSGITINPRISMDAFNGANVNGSIFQGRRAGGSAGTPTAALADYTLAGFAGDGYGTDSFHNISVGAYVIKAEEPMTNTSAPTYLSLMTTPSGSTTIAERMRIKSTGGLRFNSYGSGTNTGTPVYSLQVDASGNVIEGGMGGSASWGSITGTLSSQSDLQTALNAKLNISDTATMLSAYQTAINGKQASGSYAVTTNNLSDLSNAGTARTNLGLGTLATQSGTFSGTSSGTNTGDQTTVSGNAGTATALQTARKVNGISFDATADITTDNDLVVYAALGSPILAQTVNQRLEYANTSTNMVDGQIKYEGVYLPKAATLTGIKVYVRVLGAYTGDNNNRVGLYSYSGGTLTLVASSTNSGTLWTSAANAIQTIPFSSTYAAAAGLYFVGFIYNQSAQTTAPALASGVALNNLAMTSTAMGFTNSAKLHGTSTGTDIPASIAMSAKTASVIPSWVSLY